MHLIEMIQVSGKVKTVPSAAFFELLSIWVCFSVCEPGPHQPHGLHHAPHPQRGGRHGQVLLGGGDLPQKRPGHCSKCCHGNVDVIISLIIGLPDHSFFFL